ncbi:MAG: orotidine-5'-phosphate decarboxylase [Rothia sp. (in: high G+C Gram-positive bacteria)]|uniref:orotidine-5'-phosphate decarboxylase n=1 Tax=Rothia sp. (in: high G+C Gram-positive bacteria) TaxID=1885016 RepID=UPI0026DEC10C|nr:orotidine-5'-phosphate decarboxylase [Rothia sp. (in: high G+C Gram-positive bacteria)]MDO5750681.1 orotidine-5'-phosphate decarboxylase [Rothia sp. (in: high G+C Gram-positive bacteria)]
MASFGDQLFEAMAERGPLCVGIDPHPNLLAAWGLEDNAQGLRAFTTAVFEACAPYAAALKPQVALFERHGSAGLAVLEELFERAAREKVLIIADAKRGDIGSTMKAYADAWLGEKSPLATDSVTLSPYLGFESLRPALDLAAEQDRGVFVLALTSNPEGQSVQHVGASESQGAVAKQIIAAAAAENAAHASEWTRMGSIGLVVGATVGEALKKLDIDLSSFNGPILSPGYGAQGATAADLYAVFAGVEDKVLVNSSRGVLAAGPDQQALADAARAARDDLMAARG